MSKLKATRSCALEHLDLTGNSIATDGASWLSVLLAPPGAGDAAVALRSLGLRQCAIEGDGAVLLLPALTANQLTHLDLRESDFGDEATAPLAAAAAKSSALETFCCVDLKAARSALKAAKDAALAAKSADDVPTVELVAGKDSMAHGALALLLTVRPFVLPESPAKTVNPLSDAACAAESVLPAAGASDHGFPAVSIDLCGSAMTGFYKERLDALNELTALIVASNAGAVPPTSPTPAAPAVVAGGAAAEGGVELGGGHDPEVADAQGAASAPPRLGIRAVDLDEPSGLMPKQTQAMFDACAAAATSPGAPVTTIKMNGEAYHPPSGCSIQ